MTTKPTKLTKPTDLHHSDAAFKIISELWELCREVIYLADHIDRDALSAEDREELTAIERITVGYSITLQDIESLDEASYPSAKDLKQLRLLIQDHCYRSLTGLQATINMQQGLNVEPLVLLERE